MGFDCFIIRIIETTCAIIKYKRNANSYEYDSRFRSFFEIVTCCKILYNYYTIRRHYFFFIKNTKAGKTFNHVRHFILVLLTLSRCAAEQGPTLGFMETFKRKIIAGLPLLLSSRSQFTSAKELKPAKRSYFNLEFLRAERGGSSFVSGGKRGSHYEPLHLRASLLAAPASTKARALFSAVFTGVVDAC